MNFPAIAETLATIQAGTTIFIPSGPSGDHLFVTVFDVKDVDGKKKALLAPFESWFSKCDESCVLDASDHAFIKRKTFVGFSNCRIDEVADLLHCIGEGTFRLGVPASVELLEKIRIAYRETKRVKRYVRGDWGE